MSSEDQAALPRAKIVAQLELWTQRRNTQRSIEAAAGTQPMDRLRAGSRAEDADFRVRSWESALEQHDAIELDLMREQLREYELLLSGLHELERLSAELAATPPPTSPYHQRKRSAESAMLGAHRCDLTRALLAWRAAASPELLDQVPTR